MSSSASSSHRNPLAAFSDGQPPTIHSIAKLLASDQVKNVVVLAGAGISTSAGIPDFRSPDTGLYANLAKYNLPYPEAIFEISYFQNTPQPFFTLSSSLYPGNFVPTLTHYFFYLLHKKGKLRRVFTQNIDCLERLTGLDADKIVEAHGSFAKSRCIRCKTEVDADWIKDKCLKGEVAYCQEETCKKRTGGGRGGLVKPDIVFFGEGLPDTFFNRLSDLPKADLLITLGTSLQVQPFASLIDRVLPTTPRLLINLERVGEMGSEDDGGGSLRSFLMGNSYRETGFDFDGRGFKDKSKIRDVFYGGKTDQGVRILAREAGWEDELVDLWEAGKKAMAAKEDKDTKTSADVESGRENAKDQAEHVAEAVGTVAETDQQQQQQQHKAKESTAASSIPSDDVDDLEKTLKDKLSVTDAVSAVSAAAGKGESKKGEEDQGSDGGKGAKGKKKDKKPSPSL